MKNLSLFLIESSKENALDRIEGKDAKKNGTKGSIGFQEPKDNSAISDIPEHKLNMLIKQLNAKIAAKDEFFIVGGEGLSKTSIIKQAAKKHGYKVITLYLDKLAVEGLCGMPLDGNKNKIVWPEWALYIKEHPKDNFLLFFDEMDQATPDVMNALMPIVLEHKLCGEDFDNFFVGAAGNFEDENDALSKLKGALKSKFKPLIVIQ